MCGICGFTDFRPDFRSGDGNSGEDACLQVLARMNGTLAHRGPDEAGAVVFQSGGIAMSRLQVIDLETGTQPIGNEERSCFIVYNGEVYNYRSLRAQLKDRGYTFRTRSDTEVVLRAYEEWGSECVQRLRGMFAFAIYDQKRGGSKAEGGVRLFLARDRLGQKPLYYYEGAGRFVFGSEIKAILAHPEVSSRLNRAALPSYLVHGYVPAPNTFFQHIQELPPACSMTVEMDGTGSSIDRYWAPPFASTIESGNSTEYEERIRELLEEAVRIRLISDVPLGAFLSGGLDSTSVVAYMSRIMKQPVKTFAVGFADDSFSELSHARLAAEHFGTEHHEVLVDSDDVLSLLPDLVRHHDQPFADSSALPTYVVSRLAREHVTVALTGDGGDEWFAGYRRFLGVRAAKVWRQMPTVAQRMVASVLQMIPASSSYQSRVRKARKFADHASKPLSQAYLRWTGVFSPDVINELVEGAVKVDLDAQFQEWLNSACHPDDLDRILYVNATTHLPGDLLVKVDRMAMANSLEARSPLLDHHLVEFAARIPSSLKLRLRGFHTKRILKNAVRGVVPDEIIDRPKHGFAAPIGRWFRTDLSDYVRDVVLTDRPRESYFDVKLVRRLLDEHQSGKRDHAHQIWALLTFELWHRLYLDGSPPAWKDRSEERIPSMRRKGLVVDARH